MGMVSVLCTIECQQCLMVLHGFHYDLARNVHNFMHFIGYSGIIIAVLEINMSFCRAAFVVK